MTGSPTTSRLSWLLKDAVYGSLMASPHLKVYAVAVGAVLVALALTLYAQSLVEGNLMLLCLVAVTVSAWYGGTGPGIVATLFAIVGTDYLFGPTDPAAGPATILTERLRPALFASVAILISALSGAKKLAEDDLDRTLDTLERRVQERTEALSATNAALNAQMSGRIKAEESYRELFENASDMIYTLDLEGTFTSLNKAGQQLIGYSAEEALELKFTGIVSSKYDEAVRGMLTNVLEGATPKASKLELLGKDGLAVPVETSLRLIHRDGSPHGVQGIARDLTERERLEVELRQSQKLEGIGRLAGGVAHDFNNLLMVIQGYSDMALSQVGEDAPIHADLEEIRKAAERGSALTRQLLAFSRKQVLRMTTLDLNRLVRDTAKILGLLLGEKVHLDLQLPAGTCLVEADRSQLEQVLVNLAVNARDAMSAGGTLTIQVASIETSDQVHDIAGGRYVRLTVRDTGCGMDEVTKARLFEPFFTTKELGKGTGLGLSTVYGIVKQLGGDIVVDSTPMQGTTFEIYLPESTKPMAEKLDGTTPTESLNGKESILLVEDDPAVRAVSLAVLRRGGYRVLEARGPREALKLAAQHADAISLVFTDVVMPEMSGPEMVAVLRAVCPKPRVLYISGYAPATLVSDGIVASDCDLVRKPITPHELLRTVRQALDVREPDRTATHQVM